MFFLLLIILYLLQQVLLEVGYLIDNARDEHVTYVGLLLLIGCISVLVVAAFCFISSSRRGASMSHERRWNQPEEGVDYGSPPSSLTKVKHYPVIGVRFNLILFLMPIVSYANAQWYT